MDKNEYIRAMDEIRAPEALKESILAAQKNRKTKKKPASVWKIAAIAAACVVLIVGIFPMASGIRQSKAEERMSAEPDYEPSYDIDYYKSSTAEDGYVADYDPDRMIADGSAESAPAKSGTASAAQSTRKIIQNATVYAETKDLKKFMSAVNQSVETLDGYTETLDERDGSADFTVRIPAASLNAFLSELEKAGTVQSKQIEKSDVTDAYADTEGRIKALQTEETALLKILEKSETVADAIKVQERLAEVRGELNGYLAQKKNYDSKISYSSVTIYASETAHIVKNDTSFRARLRERFDSSVYNLGQFFEGLAVNLFGGILYILCIAAVGVVIVLIVRRVRKKRQR